MTIKRNVSYIHIVLMETQMNNIQVKIDITLKLVIFPLKTA